MLSRLLPEHWAIIALFVAAWIGGIAAAINR